ncbi:MAG TPA: hypothetical protein PKY72_03475 [Bacilli bacterium]|nr:hypothetical protein [Bacilli bacterium]
MNEKEVLVVEAQGAEVIEAKSFRESFQTSVNELSVLVNKAVDDYKNTIPKYDELEDKILALVNLPNGIDTPGFSEMGIPKMLTRMSHGDLLKLLGMCQKAKTAPIGDFTKLIQSLTVYYEDDKLSNQIKTLSVLTEALTSPKGPIVEPKQMTVEDFVEEVILEDDN